MVSPPSGQRRPLLLLDIGERLGWQSVSSNGLFNVSQSTSTTAVRKYNTWNYFYLPSIYETKILDENKWTECFNQIFWRRGRGWAFSDDKFHKKVIIWEGQPAGSRGLALDCHQSNDLVIFSVPNKLEISKCYRYHFNTRRISGEERN